MNKWLLIISGIVIALTISFFALNSYIYQEKQKPNPTPSIIRPSDEQAELTGFGFIQDFITSSDEKNLSSQQSAYQALSTRAQNTINPKSIYEDLLIFLNVNSAPEQGASVEDLQTTPTTATLIVGLNFSNRRILRAVHMIIENNQWRVDKIENLDTYPPEE